MQQGVPACIVETYTVRILLKPPLKPLGLLDILNQKHAVRPTDEASRARDTPLHNILFVFPGTSYGALRATFLGEIPSIPCWKAKVV
jgi:hypothetical protein